MNIVEVVSRGPRNPTLAATTARDNCDCLSCSVSRKAWQGVVLMRFGRLSKLWRLIRYVLNVNQFQIRVSKVSPSQPHYAFVLEDEHLSSMSPPLESVSFCNNSGYYHSAMDPLVAVGVKL